MKKNAVFICIITTFLWMLSCTRIVDYTGSSSSSTGSGSSSGTSGSSSGSSGSSGSGTSGTGTGPTAPTPLPPAPIVSPTSVKVTNLGFSVISTSPCNPSTEVFTFANTSKGIPASASYEWYFGDGNIVTGVGDSIVTNTYSSAGTYKVTMKAIYGGKTIADTFKTITAYGTDVTPNPDVTYTLVSVNIYSFNANPNLSHGSATKYAWDFGDGGIASTSKGTAQYTYSKVPADKDYTVSVTVTSNAGCKGTATTKVTVPAVYTVSGSFNYSSTSPCAPSTEIFTFTQNISGAPSTAEYKWDFGDGTGDVGKTVTKQYNDAGSRKVVLSVYNNGSLLYTYSNPTNIKSYGPDVTPVTSFDIQQDNNSPNVISFNSTSSIPHGSIKSLAWTFGDGATAVGYNVKHTYPSPGTQDVSYPVKLVVTGDSGCSSNAIQTVIVPKK